MEAQRFPVATAAMLIRRPVADVFEAFVDPSITSNFWFTTGSARLDVGRRVTWTWATYGVTSEVDVVQLETNRRLVIEWDRETAHASRVEWTFSERAGDTTFVEIRNFGFSGDMDAQILRAIESTEGFALVLAGLKAWLEHGVRIGVVHDRHPDMWVKS